jgi:hypothetical protein
MRRITKHFWAQTDGVYERGNILKCEICLPQFESPRCRERNFIFMVPCILIMYI